jgi:DNA-binding transcriptional ArsR family regulator
MDATNKMAAVAAAMSSPSRLKMLESLAGGTARSAIDLAAIADIQQNTATTHLQFLCKTGLIKATKQGRYRYFRIQDEKVADLIEVLGEHSGNRTSDNGKPMSEMAFGRTCYDHLAGWIGVQLTKNLSERALVEQQGKNFRLTQKGEKFLTELGLDIGETRLKRRVFARACQDWTEGEAHLGGALGASLFQFFESQKWLKRDQNYREVYVLPKGKKNFVKYFDMPL